MVEDAIAAHPNTLYVVAAGNAGADDDVTGNYPCSYPEANIICVGATDDTDAPASFSNYGATTVDLFAPGVGILSTVPGPDAYDYYDGTSMATPHVAATLALMRARNPSLTAAQLKAKLLASVHPVGALHGLSVTGGRLDAAAAVAAATPDPNDPDGDGIPTAARQLPECREPGSGRLRRRRRGERLRRDARTGRRPRRRRRPLPPIRPGRPAPSIRAPGRTTRPSLGTDTTPAPVPIRSCAASGWPRGR